MERSLFHKRNVPSYSVPKCPCENSTASGDLHPDISFYLNDCTSRDWHKRVISYRMTEKRVNAVLQFILVIKMGTGKVDSLLPRHTLSFFSPPPPSASHGPTYLPQPAVPHGTCTTYRTNTYTQRQATTDTRPPAPAMYLPSIAPPDLGE